MKKYLVFILYCAFLSKPLAKDGLEKLPINKSAIWKKNENKFDTLIYVNDRIAVFGVDKKVWLPNARKFITERKFGLVDSKDNILLKPISEDELKFYNDISEIFIDYNHIGYVNTMGKLFLIKRIIAIDSFKGGLGMVESHSLPGIPMKHSTDGTYLVYDEAKKGRYTLNFITKDFQIVIPAIYDSVAAYTPGQIREVVKNNKYGFLDSTATLIGKIEYDDIDIKNEYSWGEYKRVKRNGKYGFLNIHNANEIIPLMYSDTKKANDNNLIWVQNSGRKWGCINQNNQIIIPFIYETVSEFTNEGLARVGQNKQFGHIDALGKVITPLKYDNVYPFNEGMAMVTVNNKSGFVNINGQLAIPINYSKADYFQNNIARVEWYGLILFIDKAGNITNFKLEKYWFWGSLLVCFLLIKFLVYDRFFS